MSALLKELDPIRDRGVHHFSWAGRGFFSGAVSEVTPNDGYHWEGLNRGGDPKQPAWLFQYTLCGCGVFQADRQPRSVGPGEAFCATIPSAHHYQSDPACPKWIFFWLMVNDPRITERLFSHPNLCNRVVQLPPGSPVVRSATALLLHMVLGNARDRYQLEEDLFRWMLECERWADQDLHPRAPKDRLIERVRNFTLERLESPVDTSELAKACGFNRSNFSHHFRKTTGQTPAAYVCSIRLEEAARLLRFGGLSVKEVAAKAGFTDSTHFCKNFRRHFLMSPGSYRDMHRV